MNLKTWLDNEMGRNARMAKHFGLTPGAISQWRSNGVPLARIKAVRAFTQGQVSLEDMLPADVPSVSANVSAEAQHPANLRGAI